MKYYRIERAIGINQSGLNGKNVQGKEELFKRACGPNSFFKGNPVFDYLEPVKFHEKDEDKVPEMIYDYNFWWGESPLGGWLKPVSDKFKNILDTFTLTEHRFYPAWVLFQGEKHPYHVLQIFRKSYLDYLDFDKSSFNNLYNFETLNHHKKVVKSFASMPEVESYFGEHYNYDWSYERLVMDPSFLDIDFITVKNLGDLVSDRLKLAIEEAGLTGLEFHELPVAVEFSDWS